MGSRIFAGALGTGGLVDAFPALLTALKAAGSLFLLRMAWQVAGAGTFAPDRGAASGGFTRLFLFQWLNPKEWLVAIGAASTFRPDQTGAALAALQMGGLFASAAFPAGVLWLLAGAALARLLADAGRARRFNLAMGAILALSVAFVWI